VELATTILLIADLSAGAAPSVLGNGTVFIVPINALGVDYNPDYSHKIDLTLNICDGTDKQNCNPPDANYNPPIALLKRQCAEYGLLNSLLAVKPPKDYQIGTKHMRCNKSGRYYELPEPTPTPSAPHPLVTLE
jgi:hypothetical protein